MVMYRIMFRDVFKGLVFALLLGVSGCASSSGVERLLVPSEAPGRHSDATPRRCPASSVRFCDHRRAGPPRCTCASTVMW